MKKAIRIQKNSDYKTISARVTAQEHNELMEQVEKENSNTSAVLRAALRRSKEIGTLQTELEALRLYLTVYIFEMFCEVDRIHNEEDRQTIRRNVQQKMQEKDYEQQH